MFIFWGEYSREKSAAWWPTGASTAVTSRLNVKQFYVPHVYFIPLGTGTLAATVLTCSECQGQMTAAIEAYSCVLPRRHAANDDAQVLAATNTRFMKSRTGHSGTAAREILNAGPGAHRDRAEHGIAPRADMIMGDPAPRRLPFPATAPNSPSRSWRT